MSYNTISIILLCKNAVQPSRLAQKKAKLEAWATNAHFNREKWYNSMKKQRNIKSARIAARKLMMSKKKILDIR